MEDKYRIMPLCDEFMNYGIDDIIYSYLLNKSTYIKKDYNGLDYFYITYDKVLNYKNELSTILRTTKQTISNRIKRLIKAGFIEDSYLDYNKTQKIFKFPKVQDINKDWKYQKIQSEIIDCLIELIRICCIQNIELTNTIKIYAYLLNKYDWFKGKPQNYSFTKKELSIAIGYSPKSKSGIEAVKNIIELLKRENYINYIEYYETIEENGKIIPCPKLRLLKVNDDIFNIQWKT